MSPRKRRVLIGLSVLLGLLAVGTAALLVVLHRPPTVTRPEPIPTSVVLTNVRVLDVVGGTLGEPADIHVVGDTIEAIAPTGGPLPDGAVKYEGEGGTVVPGLIDSHCHVESSSAAPWVFALGDGALNMERLLYSGVTRVFDPGAMAPETFELRDTVNSGQLLGPHIYAAGPVFTAVRGHPEPMMRELAPGLLADFIVPKMTRQLATEEDARVAVDGIVSWKPDLVKMAVDRIPTTAPELQPEVAKAVVDAAAAHEVRAVAHIGTTRNALDTGEAGVSAWIHGVYKERIPDPDIARLAAFGIPMVPTLVVFRSWSNLGTERRVATSLERELLPADQLASYRTQPADHETSETSSAFLELLRENQDSAIDNVRRLHAAGVTILAGSDAQPGVVHGPSLHRELALLEEAGLSPIEALRAATLYPARFFSQKEDPPFGVVAVGKRADLVVVHGDPLRGTAALSNIRLVVLAGVPLERHALPAAEE